MTLSEQAEGLELLALGQAEWLDNPEFAKKFGEHVVSRKRDLHAATVASAKTLKALAPYERELREWLKNRRFSKPMP